jgi:beta-lactamase class A
MMMRAFLLLLLLAAPGSAHEGSRERRAPRRGLIHPLLDTEDFEFKELRPFKHELERLRARLIKEKKLTVMALYFRDLDNGLAFGIDQQLPFQPASLLKLPLMMALLKKHERDPELLRRTLTLVPAPPGDLAPVFPPAVKLEPGKPYTVDELLLAMIGRSDNDAANTLLGALTEADFKQVYEDLGLRIPNVRDEKDPVTVREYATFFRILYNASYLSKDHSQRALEYLAEPGLQGGLRGGVPPGITVAQKFGESGRRGELQFHDCGIVYHAVKPYVLCVMTRGKDMRVLADAVKEASALAYGAVDASAAK